MTSETIYNPDDYEALHDAFSHALSPSGVMYANAVLLKYHLLYKELFQMGGCQSVLFWRWW